MHDRRFPAAFSPILCAPCVLITIASLLAPAPASAQSSDCSPDLCAPGTIPLVDADGNFAGWCVSTNQPGNVEILVDSIDPGIRVDLSLNLIFDSPPNSSGLITPILLDFVQVCSDLDTSAQVWIAEQDIVNQTGLHWNEFEWSLFDGPDCWFSRPNSQNFRISPFSSRSFSDFLDPPTNRQAKRLRAFNGLLVGDGQSFRPGAGDSNLVIVADLSPGALQSFTLKQRPTPTDECVLPPIVPDGDVDGLIEAIECASRVTGPTTIELAPGGTYTLTHPHNGYDGLPVIPSNTRILGNGATIERSHASGTPLFRILNCGADSITIEELTIRNGFLDMNDSYGGGGVLIRGHTMLRACTVEECRAPTGGAISVDRGRVTLESCAILDNDANFFGAGIHTTNSHSSSRAEFTAINTTIANNRSYFGTAVFADRGTANTSPWNTLRHCTIVDNLVFSSGPAGIYTGEFAWVTLSNCIVSNPNWPDCVPDHGTIVDAGFNIIADGSCITEPTSMSGDPMLGPLGNNGGLTLSYEPLPGSPAIEAGDCFEGDLIIDQRGIPRPQGATCDIGAVEVVLGGCVLPNPVEADDAGALISAIECAIATDGSFINLTPDSTYVLTDVYNTVGGPDGLPPIAVDLVINGFGSTIVRSPDPQTPAFRLLKIEPGISVTINDLNFENGSALDSPGGAIFNDGGQLSLSNATLRGNAALGISASGGGLANALGATASLTRCTISDGDADERGGGISNAGTLNMAECTVSENVAETNGGGIANTGMLNIDECTVSGNVAEMDGGGIYNAGGLESTNCTVSGNAADGRGGGVFTSADGMTALVACTVANNTATNIGGGIATVGGVTTVTNTIVADSTNGDCFNDGGVVEDNGYNIFEDGACVTDATSVAGDPLLAPLADNGGPTQTHALLFGSIAFDGGDCAGGTLTADQRGVSRPQGYGCDIGAFESEDTCVVLSCPPDSLPLADADGDFSGWCAMIDPNQIAVDVRSVDSQVTIALDVEFADSPTPDGAIAPATISFLQICPDGDTFGGINIRAESLENATGHDWVGFDFLLPPGAPAGFLTNNSNNLGCDSFLAFSFREFRNPINTGWATRVSFIGGRVPDQSPMFIDGRLSIGINRSGAVPAAFTLYLQPILETPCSTADPIPAGDVAALAAAIDCANQLPDPNVITLTASVPYVIAESENANEGRNGLPVIASDITINGNGAILTRADDDGTPAFRLLRVVQGASLTVNDLGLTNGDADGAAARNSGALHLHQCDLYAHRFSVIRSDAESTTSLSECTVTDNLELVYHCLDIGGMLQISDCIVMNNLCYNRGGGLYLHGGSGNISDTTFVGNTAGEGGAIYSDSPLILSACEFIDNTSQFSGGGLYMRDAALDMSDCLFEGNLGGANGNSSGGAFLCSNCDLSMTSTIVNDNTAGYRAGGMFLANGTAIISDCSITHNTSGDDGGGSFLGDCTSAISNCLITNNTSGTDGGGTYLYGQNSAWTDCIISDNTANNDGGGIFQVGGALDMLRCEIDRNHAVTNIGGGIHLRASAIVSLDQCSICENVAEGAFSLGGGLATWATTTYSIALTNCTVSGNVAGRGGGGILTANTVVALDLTNCTIVNNSGEQAFGGPAGLYGAANISNSIIANNNGTDCFDYRFVDLGHNLIGDGSCITHPTSFAGDPMLGPLADNGGPTRTHALLPGSPAIDAGDCAGGVVLEDQRGVPRPQGAACDIGAFELEMLAADMDHDGDVDMHDFSQFSL